MELISRQAVLKYMADMGYASEYIASLPITQTEDLEKDDKQTAWNKGYMAGRKFPNMQVSTVIDETAEMGMRTGIEVAEDRPQAKWVRISPAKIYECTNCHQNVMTGDIDAYSYCHHCGIKMGE